MQRARYVPFSHGKYEVAAGLKPLETDFGNGERDRRLFQIDDDYDRHLAGKAAARREALAKYYPPVLAEDQAVVDQIARWAAERLAREYPGRAWPAPPTGADSARDALDALALRVPEDLAVLRREGAREWMAAIHLCFPNHWAAEDKVGRDFNAVHAPVAGFGKLARGKDGIVEMMVTKGPFVRFAWGVATDRELNHHPRNAFQGRAFDPARPELHVRVERQTLTPFPELDASLFTIRTYFLDVASELSVGERAQLAAAIGSMTDEQLRYKGLSASRDPILTWIDSL